MLIENKQGNYYFLPSGPPYSAGVIASPGYELIRTTLREPLPIREGLEAVKWCLRDKGRPLEALCALELRCPCPRSFSGFAEFNEEYRALLLEKRLLLNGTNPIARTNVAPAAGRLNESVIYAFAHSAPVADGKFPASFIVSGGGELLDSLLEPEAIVRRGETSEDALREKAALVMKTMGGRLAALRADWSQVTSVDIYTVHNIYPLLGACILANIGRASRHGVRWYNARPPIDGIEFEMDLRGIRIDCFE